MDSVTLKWCIQKRKRTRAPGSFLRNRNLSIMFKTDSHHKCRCLRCVLCKHFYDICSILAAIFDLLMSCKGSICVGVLERWYAVQLDDGSPTLLPEAACWCLPALPVGCCLSYVHESVAATRTLRQWPGTCVSCKIKITKTQQQLT